MTILRMIMVAGAVALIASACGGGDDSVAAPSSTTTIVFTETTTTTAPTVAATSSSTTTTRATSNQSATATTYRVQQDLIALGFFDGQVDGIAGDATQAALRAFQTQQGIGADGEFGPVTDAAMYPLLMEDSNYVEELQEDLTELGLYTGPIDGDYGKGTQAAVENLQGSCEIEKTGIIDIATRICWDRAG